MQALVTSMSSLRVSAQASKPFAAARCLGSRCNGIVSAPKILVAKQQTVAAPASLEIMCADGRRGGKLKTRKSAAKRYKVTGSGKVVVRHAGKNHFQEKKKGNRRNKLKKPTLASETHKDLIRGCLPYANIQ